MPQVIFRDGVRDVPDHVEQLLRGIDTYKLNFDDAIAAANRKLMNDYLGKTVNKMVSEHFRNTGGR